MRPAKGLDTLITAILASVLDRGMLVIAGDTDPDYADRLRNLTGGDGRVRIMVRHLDDQQVTALVSAANGFVLNHQTVLNSGSMLLTLPFDRSVPARLQRSLTGLAGRVGPDRVTPLDGRIAPALLCAFLGPQAISEATLEAYSQVLVSRRTGNVTAR